MQCRKCNQWMSDFGVFVLDGKFVREHWCFRCNFGLVVPAKATGDALVETQMNMANAVTEEYEVTSVTEPLPMREYFGQFRGDE